MDKTEPTLSDDRDTEEDAPPLAEEGPEISAVNWLEGVEESRRRERQVMESLLRDNLEREAAAERHRNWFRVFVAGYLLLLVWLAYGEQLLGLDMGDLPGGHHVAVVKINGAIMPGGEYNADAVIEGLRDAFDDKNTQAVILRINSPGGSPVQAGRIHDEIVRLRRLHPAIPLYAALEDLCASGGYYVAAAAQEVYADKATLVGSIGVILRGFGFQEAMANLGVESRVLTAGRNKAFLDPFEAWDPEEKAHAQKMLDAIHRQFIQAVKNGRGERLKGADAELFQGLIWTGEEALGLGLVDGLGSVNWIARELVGNEKLVDFTVEKDWISRLSKKLVESFWDAGQWSLRWGVG